MKKNQSILDARDNAASIEGLSVVAECCITKNARSWIANSKFGLLNHTDINVLRNQSVLELVNLGFQAICVPLYDFQGGFTGFLNSLRD